MALKVVEITRELLHASWRLERLAYENLLLGGGVFRSLVVQWNNSQGSCQGQNEIKSVDSRCCRIYFVLLSANLSIAITGGV